MSNAVDALATAPEALPARLKHAPFPHFMNALYDAELVPYLPPDLLEAMRRVRKRVMAPPEGTEADALSDLSQEDAATLAKEIVAIAHEVRRLSTF